MNLVHLKKNRSLCFSECNEINSNSKSCLPKQTEVLPRQRFHLIHLSYSLSHMLNKYSPIANHFHQAYIFIKYFSVISMDYHSLYASKEEMPFSTMSPVVTSEGRWLIMAFIWCHYAMFFWMELGRESETKLFWPDIIWLLHWLHFFINSGGMRLTIKL